MRAPTSLGVAALSERSTASSVSANASSSPHPIGRSASPIATSPRSSPSRRTAAFLPVSKTTAKSNSMPRSSDTSTTDTPLPATTPRVLPRNAFGQCRHRVHPDLLNSRFGYVSILRANYEAMLSTHDINKLKPQLSADVSKNSAIEISQVLLVALGTQN